MLVTMKLLKTMTAEAMKNAKKDLVREKHLSPAIFALSNNLSACKCMLMDMSTPANISNTERYLHRYVRNNRVEAVFIIGEGWRQEPFAFFDLIVL